MLVRRWVAPVLWGLVLLGGPAIAQVPSPDPAAQRLPSRVAAVTITTNGARSDGVNGDETAAYCAAFRLRPRDVLDYFAVARPVDTRAYQHDLEMSRCQAAGGIRLRNGERGHWLIDQERRGLVVLEDGRAIYLYCPRCTAKVYEPVRSGSRQPARTATVIDGADVALTACDKAAANLRPPSHRIDPGSSGTSTGRHRRSRPRPRSIRNPPGHGPWKC